MKKSLLLSTVFILALLLILGAGPAGLEAARALGQRGYDVVLAEKEAMLGGRVLLDDQDLTKIPMYRRARAGIGESPSATNSNVTVRPANDTLTRSPSVPLLTRRVRPLPLGVTTRLPAAEAALAAVMAVAPEP